MDGKMLADKICRELKTKCDELKSRNRFPKLTIVATGNDDASNVYVRNKIKRCEEIGIEPEILHFDFLSLEDFVNLCHNTYNPIIVQEPITGSVDHETVSAWMRQYQDVDGFSQINIGNLAMGFEPEFYPCTPKGVVEMLEYYGIELSEKTALVIGRSNIVGRPMAMMLEHADCTTAIAHSKTPPDVLHNLIKQSDIIVSAVGNHCIFNELLIEQWDLSKKTIVDVGMNRDKNGKLCGDMSENLKKRFGYYTPVPGGVGPMTVAMLMKNVIKYYGN